MLRYTLLRAPRWTVAAPLSTALALALVACLSGCGASVEQTGETSSALRACPVVTACDAAPPAVARGSFRAFGSYLLSATSTPNHRGHDAFVTPGEQQWIIAKLAYGLFDQPIKGEDVDVYVLRGCGSQWEKLGTARTTNSGDHPTIDGVTDDGGRVYFQVPPSKTLAPGRHRVRLVVNGDATATELFLEVVTADTPIFVSDVDGTLTTSELAEVGGVISGTTPDANAHAAEALQALAKKGYRPFYLTARAERGTERTRQFLAARGFPPGIIQTSFSSLGLTGAPAATFKSEAIGRVKTRGLGVSLGFGNTATDADAYSSAGVPASGAYFFQFDTTFGKRIEDYGQLDQFQTLPTTCQ